MEITSIQSFPDYYKKIRNRTVSVIRVIPHEPLEWKYRRNKFSPGDISRHIAPIERYLYAEIARGNCNRYFSCGKEMANGYDGTLEFFNRLYEESLGIFSKIPDEDLRRQM